MLNESRLYFAYGSNLNHRQMAERCPKAKPVSVLRLDGWRLVFKRGADIVRDEGAFVLGALYGITLEDEAALDVHEGYPVTYTQHAVLDEEGRERFFFYKKAANTLRMPRGEYLETIRAGYRDWGLDLASLDAAMAYMAANARSARMEGGR